MGLRAASTSISSSSASKNVILIQQEDINVNEIKNSNHFYQKKEIKEVHLKKDLKLISNVSVQSNMAPALTEPLSQTNKLSSSTTSASPRPISNSQFAVVHSDSYLSPSTTTTTATTTTNFNGDTNNLIDIETELLKVAEGSLSNGSGSASNFSTSNNNNLNNTKTASIIYSSNNILKGGNRESIASKKGAFQLAFEQVIAEQVNSDKNNLVSITKPAGLNINNNHHSNSNKNKIRRGLPKKRRLNYSCEKFSRQMGPMCDTTNNSTKSQLLEISTTEQEQEQQEKSEEASEGEHMDLLVYDDDNEESQHDNPQTEIKSTSSTVTAENTDIEGK